MNKMGIRTTGENVLRKIKEVVRNDEECKGSNVRVGADLRVLQTFRGYVEHCMEIRQWEIGK